MFAGRIDTQFHCDRCNRLYTLLYKYAYTKAEDIDQVYDKFHYLVRSMYKDLELFEKQETLMHKFEIFAKSELNKENIENETKK